MLFTLLVVGLFMLALAIGYEIFMLFLFLIYKIDGGKLGFWKWYKKMEG